MRTENTKQLFEKGTFVCIPHKFFSIEGITPIAANLLGMIYGLSGKKVEGLKLSNGKLAKMFGVDLSTIRRSFAWLRKRKLIRDCGPDCAHRVVKVNREYLNLAITAAETQVKKQAARQKKSRGKLPPVDPEEQAKSGGKMTQDINSINKRINIASPTPAKETGDAEDKKDESELFIQHVFVTRNGKRITAYTRQQKHKQSNWILEQKRLLGIA